jgi:hypothetical protein
MGYGTTGDSLTPPFYGLTYFRYTTFIMAPFGMALAPLKMTPALASL